MHNAIQTTPTGDKARLKLITVAEKMFAERGYHGTSTRDLARESGMNISLISYYFGNKEGLYKAVLLEFADFAMKELGHIIAENKTGKLTKSVYLKQMKLIVNGMIEMKFQRPHVHMIVLRELLSGLPTARDIFETVFESLAEQIISIVKAAQKEGIVRKDLNPYVLFLSMCHASDQFLALTKCDSGLAKKVPKDFEIYKDQLFKIFVEGSLA